MKGLPRSREYVIVGANGAGKSRFMEAMAEETGGAVWISPVSDSMPAASAPGLDRLLERLVADAGGSGRETPLSRHGKEIISIWARCFPGSGIETDSGGLYFKNTSGQERFSWHSLSRGEKTALYFLASLALAPEGALLFIDSPTIFLHPGISGTFWEGAVGMRPDCRFVFDSSDPLFVAARPRSVLLWLRSYFKDPESWDYETIDRRKATDEAQPNDDFLVELLGSRRPVLFIEGDARHSIDSRLYALLFPEFTVRPVGSCDKVIEATRTFSSLSQMHRLESHGIVDRDRRTEAEVAYLRSKGIMVPEVAEIENIFLSEGIVRILSRALNRNPDRVMRRLRDDVLGQFRRQLDSQALQHTRHKMKRDVERKIDARFTCITALELHLDSMLAKMRPREHYNRLRSQFHQMLDRRDYAGVLRVFNCKPLLTQGPLPGMLGLRNSEELVETTLKLLRRPGPFADALREAGRGLFNAPGKGVGKSGEIRQPSAPLGVEPSENFRRSDGKSKERKPSKRRTPPKGPAAR